MSGSKQTPAPKSQETRAMKVARLNEACQSLALLADEMVVLLSTHDELNWAQVYANFARKLRQARTDKHRLSAVHYIFGIYGGMGSWNDFYLKALGEAEERRSSLGHYIFSRAKDLETDIQTGVQEPTPWSKVITWLRKES